MPRLSAHPGLVSVLLPCLVGGCAPALPDEATATSLEIEVVERSSGTDVLLQAVHAPTDSVVWVSGHGGTWGQSTDGGATWVTGVVPGADTLQFRDVEGFDASTAVLLAAGTGALSGLFRTEDGGASWTKVWTMDHPDGFLDCLAFAGPRVGFAYGDAVQGGLFVLTSTDGGRTWARLPPDELPPALEGEGGFAASGACVAAGPGEVLIATGNGAVPRLLRSTDGGDSWSVDTLPLTAGPGAGATAVGRSADGELWVVGGAIGDPRPGSRAAVRPAGGEEWRGVEEPPQEGALYGAARASGRNGAALVVAGPGGLSWSPTAEGPWTRLHEASHWAVGFGPGDRGWAVGPGGRITELRLVPVSPPPGSPGS